MSDDLTLTISGTPVTGRFTYRVKGAIEVEITSSFYPFRSSIIMGVSPRHSPDGLLGDEGIISGKKILKNLNRISRHLEKHRESILADFREYSDLMLDAEMGKGLSDYMFNGMIEAVDRERTTGRIDEQEHRRRVAQFERQNQEYHRRSRIIRHGFFARSFGFVFEPELEDQILRWLRWERGTVDPTVRIER